MAQKSRTVIDPREAERRRSLLYKIGAVVVLVAVAAGVVIWAVSHNSDGPSTTGGSATPTVLGENGAITITKAPKGTDPKVTVRLVEDFQCPGCGSFERTYRSTIDKLAENPQVAIEYTPIAFLNSMSTTDYSSRAMNASTCVAESTAKDGDWTTWLKFHALLFEKQPAEGGSGLPDSDLISMAREAGADGITECINNNQFGQWVTKTTQTVTSNPEFTGTPWVRINDQKFEVTGDPQALIQAVDAALAK
ncbi:DsbA family protein [Gordonia hydrophobica]|uniref:Thioredoxin domain-containing protein n=1 Tax=Gordonia hydrophobica TaxID=40516 RepID=A0ABZ2TWV0_9ACTN|nr:thioredoxin domain-containing protein [Gordonia hydrophobica]MBM7365754.1 protein-disulfide isomerase [Gordonia hydrophobica]